MRLYTAIFLFMFFTISVHGQQRQVAILNTVDDEEPPVKTSDLNYLTDRLREIANKTLPQRNYVVMTSQSMLSLFATPEDMLSKCNELAGCLVKIGREITADYIGQGRIGRFGKDLTIKVELYETGKGGMVGSFTGSAKDIYGLLAVLDKEAPEMFKRMPGVSGSAAASPSVAGGISGVQSGSGGTIDVGQRYYLANFTTEPSGASLSFNGIPNCPKTPCSVQLSEGQVRIVSVLDQYETADTTVSLTSNNQNINIKLKSDFGILEIKPAYSDGIGKNEGWSLVINGKAISFYENKLSPNKYNVKLGHRCYEDISFDVGISKGIREVFDMAQHINLKQSGLILSAEKDGKPVSELVFVNGKHVGETPFSGTVAMCSDIGIGKSREKLTVKLENGRTVKHTHKIASGGVFTDTRDGKKYKFVKIGNQTWMAENLNYNASGSKCYDNNSYNCVEYGRLYNWEAAKKACPKGWHLPSDAEWTKLTSHIGGTSSAGAKLKSKSGWDNNGNGTDNFDFSALPGGDGGGTNFGNVGSDGYWWSSTEYDSYYAYGRGMYYNYSNVDRDYYDKTFLLSVRCAQD